MSGGWATATSKSENLIAYELGYRVKLARNLSLDLTAFYNVYDDLQSIEQRSATDSGFSHKLSGETYGLEAAADWHPREWWQLQASYTYLEVALQTDDDSLDFTSEHVGEGSSPEHQLSLRSSMDFGAHWALDLWLFYTDTIDAPSTSALVSDIQIDSHTRLSARLAWMPRHDLELSLVGHNLLDAEHLEYTGEAPTAPTEIERSVYGQVRWNF